MPPKYAIAGGIDFYDELKTAITKPVVETKESKECLLSKTELTYGHITLPCSHTFNFMPLYNEVLSQKTNPVLLKNIYHVKLNKNQIRCPYCRTIHADMLLPYIVGSKRVIGVNGPVTSCMTSSIKCQYVTKKMTGRGSKRHEVITECTTTRDIYYYETNDEMPHFLCKRHYVKEQKIHASNEANEYNESNESNESNVSTASKKK
jgi:hypothetical protein